MNRLEETLVILAEEAAEVIQQVAKIQRFGIDNTHLNSTEGITQRDKLAQEIGDFLCLVDALIDQGVVTEKELEQAKRLKANKLLKWSKIYE